MLYFLACLRFAVRALWSRRVDSINIRIFDRRSTFEDLHTMCSMNQLRFYNPKLRLLPILCSSAASKSIRNCMSWLMIANFYYLHLLAKSDQSSRREWKSRLSLSPLQFWIPIWWIQKPSSLLWTATKFQLWATAHKCPVNQNLRLHLQIRVTLRSLFR